MLLQAARTAAGCLVTMATPPTSDLWGNSGGDDLHNDTATGEGRHEFVCRFGVAGEHLVLGHPCDAGRTEQPVDLVLEQRGPPLAVRSLEDVLDQCFAHVLSS